ncbi:MAG: DUF1501 domain-containing protein [Isosphaeraceae bacterium]
MGFGLLGPAGILDHDARADTTSARTLGGSARNPLSPKPPHFPARARQIVHLFMNGGPSHVDTFDPKPLLRTYHGKPLPTSNLRTERKTGAAMGSPFRFRKYGQSGIEISDLFPHVGELADDLCVIRSMHADVPNHEPSLMLMNCGEGRQIRPSMGSWITYGLGSENQNLPGFIAMCPGGYPIVATQNWRSAFLPGAYQGTYVDTRHEKVEELVANIKNPGASPSQQRIQLDLLQTLNEQHRRNLRDDDPRLETRIQSFELAYRMQVEAADAFDVSREPKSIREMYGPGVPARQLMIARRLIERGVRFVQVWSGEGQPWDNHDALEVQHGKLASAWDRPTAAFLRDLKQRGLLETTLVMWGGEFGRTPVAELPQLSGRDHNHYGFSMWLAGGGVKGGHVHGATDEFGFGAVEDKVHVHDLHATLLHLLGLDHTRLTYRHAGRDFRLTDVHGNVVKALLA